MEEHVGCNALSPLGWDCFPEGQRCQAQRAMRAGHTLQLLGAADQELLKASSPKKMNH